MSDSRPTRASVAGRAYLDLQNLARRHRRLTEEFHQLYALEGFLARCAESPYAERLALKGGVLMAAYGVRRPTRDVDLCAQALSADKSTVLRVVKDIADQPIDDGLRLQSSSAEARTIRDQATYSGVRVTLTGQLSSAKIRFHVDVSAGDPIDPPPRRIQVPRLLGGTIAMDGYPLGMVHAEKIVTALERKIANTRWRDFADVYVLAGHHESDGDELHRSIKAVAWHRRVPLIPLSVVLPGFAGLGQPSWMEWRRRQRLEGLLPDGFSEVLDRVIRFADPAIEGTSRSRRWDPLSLGWR